MDPARMRAEVRVREVVFVFMGLEFVFRMARRRELLSEDGVFMGGVFMGGGRMMLVGWDGEVLSAGPVRDAANERNVEGEFHGGGGGTGLPEATVGGEERDLQEKSIPKYFFSGFPKFQRSVRALAGCRRPLAEDRDPAPAAAPRSAESGEREACASTVSGEGAGNCRRGRSPSLTARERFHVIRQPVRAPFRPRAGLNPEHRIPPLPSPVSGNRNRC